MRPPLCWADLAGRTVGVWGLGVEGRANLAQLQRLGVEPVVVSDEAELAGGGLAALRRCDVVVKSPGISRYRDEARDLVASGVALVGGLGLWLQSAPLERVVLVTGTKGKSTTTAVLGHLLERLGHRCLVGGNIGVVPYAPEIDETYDFYVIEVSSYQATDLAVTPPVAAVTSLSPDHLPWHADDVETYYRDKLSALTQPGAERTVANADDAALRQRADQLGPRVRWVPDAGADLGWTDTLGLLGVHNRRNAEIARVCAELLGVAAAGDLDAVREAGRGFVPLASRLTSVGAIGGVDFVDDGLATNVLPTMAAVDAFADRRIGLVVGGAERGIDYEPLARHLATRRDVAVFTIPDNGPRIAAALRTAAVRVDDCADLDTAVRRAYAWARPDGVVLLSPAAPSFGRYADYRDRAEAFGAVRDELARSAPADR